LCLADYYIFVSLYMKKEIRHRLWAWVLLVNLIYPIAVNFAHSFSKHNLNHKTALVKIDKVIDASCAIFHYIHNYNTPLNTNTFTLETPEEEISQAEFFISDFKIFALFSKNLRAPPTC